MTDIGTNILDIFNISDQSIAYWLDIFIITIQLIFISVFISLIYYRTQGTQAAQVIKGLVYLSILICIFYLLKLTILIKILELLLPTLLIGIIVVFAQEIRQFLIKLGQDAFSLKTLKNLFNNKYNKIFIHDVEQSDLTEEIVNTIILFSKNKTGAIIVFDNTLSDKLYLSSGVKINSIISAELLMNIFFPKSPLHDGAVIIRSNRIYAAAVILPITENPKLNPWQYGTRHRAAIGITENNPSSLCIVVSEETGGISIAEDGCIIKISKAEDIRPIIRSKLKTENTK